MKVLSKTEIQKCREDAVYFVEKYLGCNYYPWQKTYLRLLHKNKNAYSTIVKYGRLIQYGIMKK